MNKEQLNAAQESMIKWLANPCELGKRPCGIECAGVFELNEMSYYIFKFQIETDGKWLVGVSGGFEEDDLAPCGHTFSDMQEYDEKTAQNDCLVMIKRIMAYWMGQV
ncbi:MAG: hypothetical protein UH850_05750 [Paludibacteraceae bacterium]|nr:hypothetical protein [Paludibacteraceae bacterium]